MPHRNLNTIIIVACVSLLCFVLQRRTKTAMMVGDALQKIVNYYVDPVDEDKLLIAAMDGMTGTLDEHSEYIPRDDYESFQDNINQEFAGIGIYVEQSEQGKPVRVVTPLVGSPALEAGMRPGDLIVRVDGEDVSRMELHDVSARLKGQIGTTVNLSVRRGDEEVQMMVRRDRIELESVIGGYRDENSEWVYRLRDDPSVAYIRLTSFGERTVMELQDVLLDLDNDFSILVLDLRGNGGGLLHAAVDVSNMFLNSGRIVSTRTRGGKMEDEFKAEPGTLVDMSKPVGILINGDSASASEIVAACLQDNGRATVVGTRSYGKGTVQNILPLQFGRSALRLTVARYYRPNGENIHRSQDASEEDEWGVKPNPGMEVELDLENLEKLAKRWREDSYPSLAEHPYPIRGNVDPVDADPDQDNPDGDDPQEGEKTDAESDPPTEPTGGAEDGSSEEIESILTIDPQLRRAVEHLREQLATEPAKTTAA